MNLTYNEMLVMISLLNEGELYGLQIVDYIKKEANDKFALGSLYNILSKLEKKGYVESRWGESTAERGGNRRRYYELTGAGETAVKEQYGGLEGLYNLGLG